MADQIGKEENSLLNVQCEVKPTLATDAQHLSTLMRWNILNLLQPDFLSSIHMVLVFGVNRYDALILTKNDMVYGIGSNRDGCLGFGHSSPVLEPKKIPDLCHKQIKTFICGDRSHMFALSETGTVYTWNNCMMGEISRKPGIYEFPDHVQVTNITCGGSHYLALTSDGQFRAIK